MWTGKIFKKAFIVSCAMFVPFCELMAQDEKVYTAEYKFNYKSKTIGFYNKDIIIYYNCIIKNFLFFKFIF